jgi:hypothetical protein
MDFTPGKTSVHGERTHRIRLLGTGGSAPTIELGQRVTVTRVSTGLYRLTWAEGPGTFVGLAGAPVFGAVTPGDVKGQTCTRDTFDTANNQLDLAVWSSTFAADDLQTTEYLDIAVVFADTTAP